MQARQNSIDLSILRTTRDVCSAAEPQKGAHEVLNNLYVAEKIARQRQEQLRLDWRNRRRPRLHRR
jgi:hypothetical protein